MVKANDKQIAGSHYKSAIEPWDAIEAWGLGYLDGSAVKYLSRWRKKNGIEDLMKAIHFLEKLVEVENDRLQRTRNGNNQAREGTAQLDAQEQNTGGTRESRVDDGRNKAARELYQAYYRPLSLNDIL